MTFKNGISLLGFSQSLHTRKWTGNVKKRRKKGPQTAECEQETQDSELLTPDPVHPTQSKVQAICQNPPLPGATPH